MHILTAVQRAITIVIADDFGEFRQFIRLKLLENGFQVVAEAKDGWESVAKVAESKPDLVILDIAMPKLNGIEAAAQIRLIAPKAIIVFLSQTSDAEIIEA